MNVLMDYRLIGQRIREHRQKANLTQAELAELSGVCQQFIGCLERGKGIPSLATIMSLCFALSIDPNTLLLNSAIYDPEAPCTLRDVPSTFTDTLTNQMLSEASTDAQVDPVLAPSLFPAFDITLDESADLPGQTQSE